MHTHKIECQWFQLIFKQARPCAAITSFQNNLDLVPVKIFYMNQFTHTISKKNYHRCHSVYFNASINFCLPPKPSISTSLTRYLCIKILNGKSLRRAYGYAKKNCMIKKCFPLFFLGGWKKKLELAKNANHVARWRIKMRIVKSYDEILVKLIFSAHFGGIFSLIWWSHATLADTVIVYWSYKLIFR